MAEMDGAMAAPQVGRVLLEGKAAKFFYADITAMSGFNLEALSAADRGMEEVGLVPTGDIVCFEAPGMIIRGYGAPGRNTLGIHVQQVNGGVHIEFFSLFENGASLTTTAKEEGESYPKRKIYRQVHPRLDASPLYRKHLEGISAFEREHLTSVRLIEPDVLWTARVIDDFLVRLNSE